MDGYLFLAKFYNVFLLIGGALITLLPSNGSLAAKPQFTAMFVFGDSLIDPGNNNDLNSLAKANYVPYGVDFDQGAPTGRFCNGKTIIDFLGNFFSTFGSIEDSIKLKKYYKIAPLTKH